MRNEVWGPLHGVPITLEDAHATAGLRSTWGGYPSLASHVPSEDSTVPARLRAAGAIVLGKTHGPAIWEESVFGRTNNPWDLARTSGGSSAGPAAALAAGLSALDIGLDTLGSIQNPAHYCGIYGMRPTEHRVPLTGVFFIDPIRKFRIMSVTGPMARSVEDLRLALQIISGPDGRDTHVPPVPWHQISRPALRELRLAWATTFPGMPIAHDIDAATRIWWIIRSAPVNAFRADFPFIQPSREVASSCSSPPPSALSFTVPPLPFRGAPSRFRGSQKAEHGTGGRGEQRTSPAVHRRFVFPAARASVRCR
jgi:Asp-tRNA(Asn)/Glu-tRNA(Gln) amidotransferase A subunit family amidase